RAREERDRQQADELDRVHLVPQSAGVSCMTGMHVAMTDFSIVDPDDAKDAYADSDVPGEFRRLTDALGAEQLSATLIRVPAHSDFEQGTGHTHAELEELYIVTRGTLTMRFGDEVHAVSAPAIVRVPGATPRSHRNEG